MNRLTSGKMIYINHLYIEVRGFLLKRVILGRLMMLKKGRVNKIIRV